jgi:phage shock protein A
MDEKKVKSFFDRPEGKLGLFTIVAGVFGFFYLGDMLLPLIIRVLQNTIYTGLLIAFIAFMGYIVTNKSIQNLISNVFKLSMRWLTGLVITIDPIGILKNYLDIMKEKINNIETQITKLNEQKMNLSNEIKRGKKSVDANAELALAAKKQGKEDQYTLYSRKAQRAISSVNNLEVTFEKMELIYKVLDKMKRNVTLLYEDTKDEVKTKEMEYKSIKAAHSAMSSASKLISGDSDRDMFEQSLEFIAEDMGNKMGEIDRIMDTSEDFMNSVDLQNGVWDQKASALLEDFEKNGTLFRYEEKKIRVADNKESDYIAEQEFSTDKEEFKKLFVK